MKTRSAQVELVHMDLQTVIEEMNNYASRRLMNVDVKQLEGKTPDDFSSVVLLKVLEGTFNWETAATQDFRKFLFGCLRTECSNFLKHIGRRGVSITEIMEEKFDFDNLNGVTYAEPHPFRGSKLISSQENDEAFHPKGYNNLEDEVKYNE
jgi:hypothetical protein